MIHRGGAEGAEFGVFLIKNFEPSSKIFSDSAYSARLR